MIDYARLSTPPPRWDNVLFWAFRAALKLLLKIYFRLEVQGSPPAAGGYVLAANHSSFVDPLLVGCSVPRRVIYLMTETVWRSARVGWFFRWNRTVPLSARGGNREALRAAREVLKQQRVVGIFPEGGVSRDGKLMLGSPGAVSLVLSGGLPIVPVGIVGAAQALPAGAGLPRPAKVVVRFGAPITPEELDALGGDRRARLQNATELIMQRIAELTGQQAREDVLAAAQQQAAIDA